MGRVDWMPVNKVWRVIWYEGKKDVPKGDFKTREEAWDRLQSLIRSRPQRGYLAASVARLTRAKEITLTRAEGLHSEVDKPVTLQRQRHPDIWAAANGVLFDWSWTAPKGGGYDKVDFTIVYDDGEKYTGRYDLKHYSDEYPNLASHVYDFVRFTAGKYKGALTQEEYDRFKEQAHFKKLSPEFLKFLDKYEIGLFNIMEKLPEVKQAEKGWKDFFKGNRIQAMIDSTNYRIGARNVSEAEQKRLHESLKTDFKDLVAYQNLQSWGFASGLLTKDEAELLYRIYGGESPSAEKWDNLTLGEKVATTKLADELLGVKLKKTGYSARTLPKLAEDVPFLQTKGIYEGGWKPGDVAIYTDFGLRSLFVVQILPWPVEKPDLFTDDMGVVHNRILGSVRAKVIDTTMVDWDFQRPPKMGKWNEVGTSHYYHFTNLYGDIHDLIAHEARVLKPDVLNKTVKDLKAHAGWEVLKRFGLTGVETLKLGDKMIEVPLEKKASYVTIENPGKTTFTKGAVVSPEAFAEENERVRKRGEKEATGWTGDKGEWPHDGNGGNQDLELLPRCSRLPQTSKIDIRQDYDEKAGVNEGILYRKGSIIQVWWDKLGKETWSGPDEEDAKRNFQAMKERWTEPISAQTRNEPIRRPKREGDLEYFADSPEFLANTIEQTGWREQLDKEFQLAIARTR